MEGIWKARRHSALDFDGIDDYCNCGSDSSLDIIDAITISAWICPKSLSGTNWNAVVVSKAGGNGGYRLVVRDSLATFSYGNGAEYKHVHLSPGVDVNRWWHVAATWDKQTVNIHVNGIRYSKAVIDNWVGSSTHLVVARDNMGGGTYFNGFIASVRIYNRALSEAEVKYLYYNPDDPLDTDHLVLWLHPGSIDTDAGYWWDISGNDNHGQIFGATKVSLVSPEVTVL